MCLLPQDAPSLSRCPQSTGEASPTLGPRIQDLPEKRDQIMTKEPDLIASMKRAEGRKTDRELGALETRGHHLRWVTGQFWVSPSVLSGKNKDKHWEEHSTWRERPLQRSLGKDRPAVHEGLQEWTQVSEMTHGISACHQAPRPELILKVHMVEREDQLPPTVLSPPSAPHDTCAPYPSSGKVSKFNSKIKKKTAQPGVG